MEFAGFVIVCCVIVPGLFWLFDHRRRVRRRRIMQTEPPATWRAIIETNVPLFACLTPSLQSDLMGYVAVFLDEKTFEGCGGLEVTEEIRVTVAAQACFLLLNRGEPSFYPGLLSIVIYPSAYVVENVPGRSGEIVEDQSVRLGESWAHGTVVLAWDDVAKGTREFRSGHNVVIHEFAHQLDQEDGAADGAPILERSERYGTWARVLGKEFERLQRSARRHKKSLLDTYGATNPAEFFAVATETFFEKGRKLRAKHPELYEELRTYYRMDPAEWF